MLWIFVLAAIFALLKLVPVQAMVQDLVRGRFGTLPHQQVSLNRGNAKKVL